MSQECTSFSRRQSLVHQYLKPVQISHAVNKKNLETKFSSLMCLVEVGGI